MPCLFSCPRGIGGKTIVTPTTYRHNDEHGIWISPFVHMPLPWQGQG
nr:MAG TPA: hypothetical protein [Caudoviricetes sp.]